MSNISLSKWKHNDLCFSVFQSSPTIFCFFCDVKTKISGSTGTDIEQQSKELRKLLICVGIDLENDLSNPEVMQIITNVLKNFDPTKHEESADAVLAVFQAQGPLQKIGNLKGSPNRS